MSYLLDRKLRRKRIFYAVSLAVVFFALFYFRNGVFNNLSATLHKVLIPVLSAGNNAGGKLSSFRSYFISKNSLYRENQNLKSKLNEMDAKIANYNSVLDENYHLKNVLGRAPEIAEEKKMVLGAILSKPNRTPYDTLIIDIGEKEGAKEGSVVFALGNVPIGKISDVFPGSSKVVLFSSAGEKTQAVVSSIPLPVEGEMGPSLPAPSPNIFLEVVGRGGGNFEMIAPRDLALKKGDQAVLPGITPFVLGTVQAVISSPRDPFLKALLVSPVNIQELKFVQMEPNPNNVF